MAIEFPPADARRMAAALGICLRQARLASNAPPLAVVGRRRPPAGRRHWSRPPAKDFAGPDAIWSTSARPARLADAGHRRLDAAGGILVGNSAGRPQQVGLKFFAPGPVPVSRGPLARRHRAVLTCRRGSPGAALWVAAARAGGERHI